MSVLTEDPTKLTTHPKATVPKPMALVVCFGALVTLVATTLAGMDALLVASSGTLLAILLFVTTHFVDWVLWTKSTALSKGNVNRMALTKRLAFGMLIRGACALAAMAFVIRFYGVDSKLAVAIALPLYCGLLLAEVANAARQQETNPPLQARI